MNSNKTVFFATGVLLIILGAFMLIPFLVQFIYNENSSTFLSSSAITIFIGILLWWYCDIGIPFRYWKHRLPWWKEKQQRDLCAHKIGFSSKYYSLIKYVFMQISEIMKVNSWEMNDIRFVFLHMQCIMMCI